MKTEIMEGEIKNLAFVWLSVLASLCYCYIVPLRIAKGKYRFFSLLPIFILFTFLPLRLTSAFATAVFTFFITWLANFKLLLFAFDQGPLSSWGPQPQKSSLSLFIAITALPVKVIKQKNDDPSPPKSSKPKKLPLNLPTEFLGFGILIGLLYDHRESIPPQILLVIYCCLVFLLVDILIALSNAVVRVLTGLELEPPSDEPYLSTSLREFWGRRWNLMVTNILRHTVYRPVRSASEAVLGDDWAPLPAVLASFLVSGLMHELLFFYVTRASPSWEITLYFMIHGVCVVAEIGVSRAVGGRGRLPWFVSGPLTVGFVVATSFWLFFPPLVRNGADVKVIEEFRTVVVFVMSMLGLEHVDVIGPN